MSEHRGTDPPESKSGQVAPSDRLVYVLPAEATTVSSADEIDLRKLWGVLWNGRWIIVVATAMFAAAGVAYALLATEWYRAEVKLVPADSQASKISLRGQLGGLAALAGLPSGDSDTTEALAVLQSRQFAAEFIQENDLVKEFFRERWDDTEARWRTSDPEKIPDIRDAVKYFHEDILAVTQDRKTNVITLSIEWTDPTLARNWAAELVGRINGQMRERAIEDASKNIEYLRAEMMAEGVVALQQSVGRLLETEMQKLMLARGNEEFSFKVVDSPQIPKERVRPERKVIVVIATLAGGFFSMLFVIVRPHLRGSSAAVASA